MKLNLGCGSDIRPGYVNVDFRSLPGVNLVVDLSVVPWPFAFESVDEILMLDFLEHFPYSLTEALLMQCFGVLRPRGELVIQVPDVQHLARALSQEGEYLCNRCGEKMWEDIQSPAGDVHVSNLPRCPRCGQSADSISEAAMRRMFGGQDFPGNFHQTAFTKRSLELKAHRCGFTEVPRYEEEAHQWANWNFKTRFVKGDVW